MSFAPLVTLAAAEAAVDPGISPELVGGVVFLILLALLGGLLAFGAGRDHS
jgi:hypothetical protein